jgi:hypothetical protein
MAFSGRKTGKLGALYLDTSGTGASFAKVADVYEWSYEETLNTFNCTIKGESFSRFRPGQNSARITVSRYVPTIALLAPLCDGTIATGSPVQFSLWAIDNNSSFTNVSGQGYVTRGTIRNPHNEKVQDEIEITVDGTPYDVT